MGSGGSAVGLVLHPTRQVGGSVETIMAFARANAVRVLVREGDRGRVPEGVGVVSDADFVAGVDAVVALGGDGTMLGAMRLLIDRPVPVLGVNHGDLGFLVEVTPAGLPSALARLTEGDFTIERHACLEVGPDDAAISTRFGFNDVVLGRPGRGGAVSLDLAVNGLRYGYYRGDAVVVSTPTGSTAYNYAAGGPVLSPSCDAVVITPVAPMSGISRPVVLGAQDRIRFTVAADGTPVVVDVDGVPSGELGHGAPLTIGSRPEAADVVRLSTAEHAGRSRIKLSLLDLPLRPDQLLDLIPPSLRRDVESLHTEEADPTPDAADPPT
ncbi:NAD+ kinase [Actinocorallia herbida]|uniref:NAD kinase n=1 Tax=Actinocorallia herbida TaxID=58109 RepID=A0A3N1CY63_9ACTN|nr:NAD(+)/NADH kinase [Actinocorallia herbida]ROO85668.1 NAD+ kinase [Actinocorallia herbida]